MQWCHRWYHWLHVMQVPMVSNDQESHVAPLFDHLVLRNVMLPLIMLSASHNTGTGTSAVTWPKRLFYTSFKLSWLKECSGAIDCVLGTTWCWHWCQWHQMIKKVILHLSLIVLTWEIQWFHWWSYHQHVVLTLVLMAYHDQWSPVAPHFSFLDLRNAVVALICCWHCAVLLPVVWHDQKRQVAFITMMSFMIMLTPCNTDPSYILWHQHQWYHMMPMPVAVVSHDPQKPCYI